MQLMLGDVVFMKLDAFQGRWHSMAIAISGPTSNLTGVRNW